MKTTEDISTEGFSPINEGINGEEYIGGGSGGIVGSEGYGV